VLRSCLPPPLPIFLASSSRVRIRERTTAGAARVAGPNAPPVPLHNSALLPASFLHLPLACLCEGTGDSALAERPGQARWSGRCEVACIPPPPRLRAGGSATAPVPVLPGRSICRTAAPQIADPLVRSRIPRRDGVPRPLYLEDSGEIVDPLVPLFFVVFIIVVGQPRGRTP
jgi:hypothetical protein